MSEREGEPQAADVRSFLPRPGEPVEEYAARLRALHHDLTLVLDAVERGLAAADRAPVPEPEPVGVVPADPHPEPHRSPPPPRPLAPARGSARVEVVAAGRAHASSGREEPASWGGRPAPIGERAPDRADPVALSPERSAWVERPPHEPREGGWVEPEAWDAPPWRRAEAEAWDVPPWQRAEADERDAPPWTERRPSSWPPPPRPPAELSFVPPYRPSRRRPALSVSPLLIAATILGWLTVLALILALALD